MSVMVPAANGTIARRGRVGHVCASALNETRVRPSADTSNKRDGFMVVLHCKSRRLCAPGAKDNGSCHALDVQYIICLTGDAESA